MTPITDFLLVDDIIIDERVVRIQEIHVNRLNEFNLDAHIRYSESVVDIFRLTGMSFWDSGAKIPRNFDNIIFYKNQKFYLISYE
jgi:hypothetical protein